MDPLTNIYERLRQSGHARAAGQESNFSGRRSAGRATLSDEPRLEEWLRYWNDDDTDLGNLRNFEHWLAVGTPSAEQSARRD